jgi:hypothetical protein
MFGWMMSDVACPVLHDLRVEGGPLGRRRGVALGFGPTAQRTRAGSVRSTGVDVARAGRGIVLLGDEMLVDSVYRIFLARDVDLKQIRRGTGWHFKRHA